MVMKNVLIPACLFLAISFSAASQPAQDSSIRETARAFVAQGDYNNAILVLNRAIENDNSSLELKKDLAFAYYLQRNYGKALEIAKPVTERKDADVQSFQILGMVYKAIEQ